MRRILFALLLALGLAHPAAAKDDLTIGLTQFPSTFNPLIDAMLAKTYILSMTRRPITTYDKDWKLVCLLCTELPTVENGLAVAEDLPDGKKGMAITIKLQPKATWGDNVPVTADDVVFTWEVGKHPKSGVGNLEAFRRILKIDVKDPKTVVLHVDRITFDYNAMGGFDLLPAHLERAKFADPVEYKHRTTFDSDTTNKGLYFGPYRISEVAPGSHVTLVPNETWYGRPPYFKRIVVRVIENTAALEANLRAGGIDYIAGELGLSLDQALALEKRQGDKYNFIYKAGLNYEHVDLNLDNPILERRARAPGAALRPRSRSHLEAAVRRQAAGRRQLRQPARLGRGQGHPALPPRSEKGGGAARRRRLVGDEGRLPPQRHGRAAVVRAHDHGRQPLARAGRAGAAEPVAGARHRHPHPQRAGARVLRRDRDPAQISGVAMYAWISSPEKRAAHDALFQGDPDRREQLGGPELPGFNNPEMDR